MKIRELIESLERLENYQSTLDDVCVAHSYIVVGEKEYKIGNIRNVGLGIFDKTGMKRVTIFTD